MGGNLSQTQSSDCQTSSIVWLDKNVNKTPDNIKLQLRLEKIIDFLTIFDDMNKCEEHIKQCPNEDQIILIVSGSFGEQLIPCIHELPQLSWIYVFCMNEEKHRAWAKKYEKKLDLVTKSDQLIQKVLSKTASNRIANDFINIVIYNGRSSSTTELNGQFVHSQLLIDCLLRMYPTNNDKTELIEVFKKKLKDDQKQRAILHEFERKYSSDSAIHWYTRDSFLYRMMNKALCMQDIDLIFLFRFFIHDIQKQLEQNQCLSLIHVYRGQSMSKQELERLKASVGKLISINSFFSTSADKTVALTFLRKNINDEKVLLEIKGDPLIARNRPIADITNISYYTKEKEVLFMLGSIFRLDSIVKNDADNYWTMTLTLYNDDNNDLKTIIDNMRKEYSDINDETDLLSFGRVLWRMGQFDKATQYFRRLLSALPWDHENVPRCYYNLSIVADETGDYNMSLLWHQKYIRYIKQTCPTNDIQFGDIYVRMGDIFNKKDDWEQALKAFNKALRIFKKDDENDLQKVAMCFNKIGNVYQRQSKYSAALECHQKALDIHEDYHETDHPYLGLTHNNLGMDQFYLGQNDLALYHLKKSLDIKWRVLPPDHPDIAGTLANMGYVYTDMNDSENAQLNLAAAAKIFSPNHPNRIQIEKDIQLLP